MAKGNIAKQVVTDKIAKIFGDDFIGEVDKKLYVWADDGGQKVQIAIALTCPKIEVECGSAPKGSDRLDFENMTPAPQDYKPAEISAEEQKQVADLMARLGL